MLRSIALLWMCIWFLSACQPRIAPMSPHLEREKVSSDYLLESLLKRQADIRNLRSFVQTTIEKNDWKQSLRQAVVVCGNEAIRIDTFSLFGQALWVFMHDGNKVLLYDSANNRIYREAEVWNIMDEVVGVVIDFKEIIDVFYGNIPRLAGHRVNRAYLDREKQVYQLETVGGQERFEVDMDAVTLLPLKWVKIRNGRRHYAVTWSDYKPLDERPFPHHIDIVNLERRDKIVVNYQSPKINTKFPADVFELPGLGKAEVICRAKTPNDRARSVGGGKGPVS